MKKNETEKKIQIIKWIIKYKFKIVGSFFFILQLMLLYKYIFIAEFSNMLWFCSHVPFLFGIAFFIRNINLIKSLISIGLTIQIIWIIDYLGKLFLGIYIIGETTYMFNGMDIFSYTTSIFEHFFSSILALVIVYKYKPKKEIFIYAFIYLIIILILTLIFSSESQNYNLVYNLKIFNEFTFPGYSFVWIFMTMILIVIPTYYLQIILYRLNIKK